MEKKKGSIFTVLLMILTFVILVRGLFVGTIYVIEDFLKEGEISTPDFIGMPIVDALKVVPRYRLRLNVEGEKYDDHMGKNIIISQEPPPGSSVKKGRTIGIIISKGKKDIVSPDITGLTQRKAEGMILGNNFSLGKKSYAYSEKVKKGNVIAQTPGAGLELREGQFIQMLISKGKREEYIIVPDFSGENYVSVKNKIISLGLNFKDIEYDYDESKNPGEVISHTPIPGKKVLKGTPVILKVNKTTDKLRDNQSDRKEVNFEYSIPDGILEKELRVVLIDDMGIKEVHRNSYQPGTKVSFKMYVVGKGKALIYIDNLKIDEREY
ncbi:MAG: hypothetical protein C0601_13515 [Candidatus Muiribacterium halophilum]|uniref:PASTA domain-containing protein n=1 Tax=Muiribacterium halophilum TaxID=2053465 RepID=A0A2N5Z9A1_MUIH1|nr:MAG: hypothetical protein C0601_13515 [Candidatus Muirbacterium halophilum]